MTRFPAPEVYIIKELADFLKKLSNGHKFLKWITDMKGGS